MNNMGKIIITYIASMLIAFFGVGLLVSYTSVSSVLLGFLLIGFITILCFFLGRWSK